jgi:hypothetical protein
MTVVAFSRGSVRIEPGEIALEEVGQAVGAVADGVGGEGGAESRPVSA